MKEEPDEDPVPREHQPWCGDASLSRPDDECTCAITPQMQYAQRDQFEAGLGLVPRDCAVSARHQPRRGDDVEAWLGNWRTVLASGDGDVRCAECAETVDDMLEDYRLRADTGTPLDAQVPGQ